MKDHVIICGFGQNGRRMAEALKAQGIGYVIIEKDRDAVSEFYRATPDVQYVAAAITDGSSRKILVEDAKSEETLLKAGVQEAKALLITVSSDAEAAFISLMARNLNPSIPIIAKAEQLESIRRLYQAGASKVISPSVIGGKMAARAAVKPVVRDFVDLITFMEGYDIAKLEVSKGSGFYQKDIQDLKFPADEVSILAVYRDGKLMNDPPGDTRLEEGDILVVLGPSEELLAMARG